MTKERTVSEGIARVIFEGAVSLGVCKEDLNTIPGIQGSNFTERLSIAALLDMFQMASDQTGDLTIGTKIGAMMRPTRQVGAFYAASFCDTLRDATELIIKYQPINQELGQAFLEWTGTSVHYVWVPYIEDPERVRFSVEAAFAIYAQLCQWQLWSPVPVIKSIHFQHDPPQDLSIFQSVYGCKPEFNARRNEISFDLKTMNARIPGRNPDILNMLTPKLDEILNNLITVPSTANDCRTLLMKLLGRAPLTLSSVSAHMQMSERQLRRLLADQRTGFREILAEVRRETAIVYLADLSMPISEVAQALGYNDQSAFTRAFKNWYHESPADYRRNIRLIL